MECTVDTQLNGMTQLFQDLKQIQAKQGTGKLIIRSSQDKHPSDFRQVYFYLGRIVWSTGGNHPIRRWFRALKQHCPNLLTQEWFQHMSERSVLARGNINKYWEVQILWQALQEKQITLAQAKAVIQNHVEEVFFDLADAESIQTEWIQLKELPQQFVWLLVEQVIQKVSDFSMQWRSTISEPLKGSSFQISPNLAPVIKNPFGLAAKVSPNLYEVLSKILNGRNTFWDVALNMQKPLIAVICSLLPLLRENILELQQIPDWRLPIGLVSSQSSQVVSDSLSEIPLESVPKRGLIACIDDSPVIGKDLEAILIPIGYEVLSILDPLHGVSTLLKHKPNLIFLDLVMPNTNGYELCSFLRKTAAFRDIPIVMLTGHDGVIDRLRAKVAGSSDFLSKPPEPEKVLQVIERFLGSETVPS
jgi:chemotaxis family two-component system response regulator PixG